jgi:hypothetical protein
MTTLKAFILLAITHLSFAQENHSLQKNHDPLFPSRRKINMGLISTYTGTTPPPVLIADATYGISNKLSLGIVGGTTGALALYGLRLNAVLFQQNNFRGIFRMNAIYYPGRDGKFLFDHSIRHVMPWMFTMGIADAEWKTRNGTRWSLGLGYLETHCIDGMMKLLHLSNDVDKDEELPFQLYNVLHGAVSFPLSKKLTLRPEVVVVMRGFSVIEKTHDSKVSPFNPYLNLVYSFGH